MSGKQRLQDYTTKNDGDGYVNINGNIEPAFKFSKLEINTEIISEQRRFLNETTEQTAARGMKINGSIAFYAATNALSKAIEAYKNGGAYPSITIQGFAKIDSAGNRSEVLATDVIISKLTLISLEDNSSDTRIYESDITANDFQIIQ